jgi:L-amino acid N-acyltransferase YncA
MYSRVATPNDAAAIAGIYNQGMEDRVATFETEPRTSTMIQTWFDGQHPIVVVEHNEEVIAYASSSSYRPRACYAGIVEFSVYVRRDWRSKGVGRLAIARLIQECEAAGFWKLVSRVFVENVASRTLLKAIGFREVGVYEKHGQLDGVWRDVVIVELLLSSFQFPRSAIGAVASAPSSLEAASPSDLATWKGFCQ